MEGLLRTEAFLHGVSDLHSVPPDRGSVLADVHFGIFCRGCSGGFVALCGLLCYFLFRWIELVAIVCRDDCFGGVISSIACSESGRADVDYEGRYFVCGKRCVQRTGRSGTGIPPPYWTIVDEVQEVNRRADHNLLHPRESTFSPVSALMAGLRPSKTSKKRKDALEDESHDPEPQPINGNLEMLSEDEGEEEPASDDGQLDNFPEIDTASDSEEDLEDDDEDEEDEFSDSGSDSDVLGVFPKPKIIVSNITGQPKKVYAEIEPDYDSDSSTEEVHIDIIPVLFCKF